MTVRLHRRRRAMAGAAAVAALGAFGLASGAGRARAQDGDAAGRIRSFYATLLDTMKQGGQLGVRGRYDRLMPAVNATFDVAGMARTAAGPGWDQATPAQQSAITSAFAHMMAATYAGRFASFKGEKFEVLGSVDQPPGKLVRTRIVKSDGQPVALDYRMRNVAGGWKVADVQVDGSISELAIRRSEFGGIMRSRGPDELATSIRQKGDQLLR
jgi:phospholipid transport system substrate-binding protein